MVMRAESAIRRYAESGDRSRSVTCAGGRGRVDLLGIVRRARQLQRGRGIEDATGLYQAFVVSQASGIWGKAEEVPGSATLN